ncbi:MAG: Citrate lyase subunit beta-like protein, partial [Actinomycetia bacterium]|nr:Citrate lyase subunit beta-like protein [Actinomycetes bacterium]
RSSPDVIVLDLEDAVPAAGKVDARTTMREAAAALAGSTVLVRVNPPATEWFEGDVASLPGGLAGVVVPKYEAPLDVGLPVVAGLETVRGVADAGSILAGTVACYFGAEDYVADLGGVRTAGNAEVQVARALVGMAARLAGIPALDMVTLDFGDTARFVSEATEARALGYAGKLCIHPAQVGPANEAFVPSADEVDRAQRLLAAFEAGGGATVAFEGQMVDEVVARQARALLERQA